MRLTAIPPLSVRLVFKETICRCFTKGFVTKPPFHAYVPLLNLAAVTYLSAYVPLPELFCLS